MAAGKLIECVPNFSEGRDLDAVAAIEQSIRSAPGVTILDRSSDADHNRSVITFCGAPGAAVAGAFRGIASAVERLDLGRHRGVHPRIGVADVVPFVPLTGATLEDCAELARTLAARVWSELGVPVYLYEAASPGGRRLEQVRRGGVTPDFGGANHPTAGAVAIGARRFLIAYNINLGTRDVTVAKSIARAIRASSGGMPAVKALGLELATQGLTQVSMNLVDFEVTGIAAVRTAVHALAAQREVPVAGEEIIGLVPRRAAAGCDTIRILEDRIETFAWLDRIADAADPAAGGAAAALTGALGASLGAYAAQQCGAAAERFYGHRMFFVDAAEQSGAALRALTRDRNEAALRHAIEVSTTICERARELDRDVLRLKEGAPASAVENVITALGLARAARAGGMAEARLNLAAISDDVYRKAIEERLDHKLPK